MNKQLPFVSIVIPTRDRPSLLAETLASLLEQEYPPDKYEVIVVDDSDPSPKSSSPETTTTPAGVRVKHIRPARRGVNAARNEGVVESSADLLCFVDDDIEAPPEWLRKLIDGALDRPNAGCWGGRIRLRLEAQPPRMCVDCRSGPLGTELDLGADAATAEFVWSANMVVPRRSFEAVGLFDDRLAPGGDEQEWQLRLKAAGLEVAYIHSAWLWHRRTAADLTKLSLMTARYRRARNSTVFVRTLGDVPSHDWLLLPRAIFHALARRCWNGVFMAGGQVGNLVGRFSSIPAGSPISDRSST